MNPYRDYMQKKAFDPAMIAEGLQHAQHFLHHPVVHAGGMMAAAHVGANALALGKKHIAGATEMLSHAGARAGLTGRKLNPVVESITNNIFGPELLAGEFNAARAQGAKALHQAGGDQRKALDLLRDSAVEPVSHTLSETFEPLRHNQRAIANLPDDFLDKKPHPFHTAMTVDKDAPHQKLRANLGHGASILGAMAIDPGAGASLAWNAFKTNVIENPTLRNHPLVRGKGLDPAHVGARDFAEGLQKGQRHPAHQLVRNLILTPESESLRNMGAKFGEAIPHPDARGPRPMKPIELDQEKHLKAHIARERMAAHLRTPEGRDMVDHALVALQHRFMPHDPVAPGPTIDVKPTRA